MNPKKTIVCLVLVLVLTGVAQASPIFVNGITIPGGTGDVYGTSVNDGRLGFFSDLYYDPNRNEWWGLSDRGPGGGTIPYETRVQRFTLDIDPNTGAISNFQVVETIKFMQGSTPFNGLAPNPANVLGTAFDPEGFVVHPTTGHFLVSDEYGPSLYEFDRKGQFVRAYTPPANVVPRNPTDGAVNYASNDGNTAGKSNNRGYEGLAISPDGRYVYAMLQSQMLDEGNAPYTRIIQFDTASGQAIAQFAYKFDIANKPGISALVAVNDHQFLVLERNNRGLGVDSKYDEADKRVYLIDIMGATDVTTIDLDAPGANFTPVTKAPTPWIDLDGVTLAELGNRSPEKWEGLAIGPRLADGTYVILAGTDNDYSVTQNDGGTQFDVWFDFRSGDRVQCTLGAACAPKGYSLLPGVLYAYKTTMKDPAMETYVAPVSKLGSQP